MSSVRGFDTVRPILLSAYVSPVTAAFIAAPADWYFPRPG